jgi:hypothetical protein
MFGKRSLIKLASQKEMGSKATKDKSLQLEPDETTEPQKELRSRQNTLPHSNVLAKNRKQMSLETIFKNAKGNPMLEMFVLSTYIKSTTSLQDWNFGSMHKFEDDTLFCYYLNMFDAKSFSIYMQDYIGDLSYERISMISTEKLRIWTEYNLGKLITNRTSKVLKRIVTEGLIPFGTSENPHKLLADIVTFVTKNPENLFTASLDQAKSERTLGQDFIDIIEILMYNDRTFPIDIFTDCHPKISTLLLKFYKNANQMMEAELSTKEHYINNLESKIKKKS